ncbi:MAG: DUF2807 domain-containing protein [bacterium]|nr:DUF2807 domain-containing protein [bacterium]
MLKTLKILLMISLISSISMLTGCAKVNGNGVPAKETRNLSNFTSIVLKGGSYKVRIHIAENNKNYMTISGDQNIVPLVKTKVNNNTLRISSKKSIKPNLPLALNIYTNNLNNLVLYGAGDIKTNGIKSKSFSLTVKGSWNINLNGHTDIFTAVSKGLSQINTKELKATNVNIEIDGAGKADVFVDNNLQAIVKGIGTITYYGNPKIVNPTISGLGKISKKTEVGARKSELSKKRE